jgi:hypothetical protein
MDDGDVYDCIDVNVQPAFNHPLLKDHIIQVKYFRKDMIYNLSLPQTDINLCLWTQVISMLSWVQEC